MNPQSNDQIGHQLPTPVAPSAAPGGPNSMPNMPPMAPSSDVANTMPQGPQTVPLPAAPMTPQGAQQPPVGANSTTISDVPVTAEDTDLIEKQWVVKAKSIVNNTQDDPYSQSKQLTAIKADYLQKRYNKNLKLGE